MSSHSMEQSEATVLAALDALYQKQTAQPEQRKAADAFLRAFQLTPEAFQISTQLLDRFLPHCQQPTHVPIVFFASQTLANKLRRQHTMNAVSYLDWSKKLVQWLSGNIAMPKMVQTQLILALIACVARISDHELATIQPSSSTRSVLAFALEELAQAHVTGSTVAEFLALIVEEIRDLPDRSMRERMRNEVDAYVSLVLDQMLPQILQSTIERPTATAIMTQQLVLRALKNWIRDAIVAPEMVVNNAIVQSIVSFLRQDELFDSAVDLIVELVRRFGDPDHDRVLIEWIVPQVMSLRADFQRAAAQEDTDACLGLCRIFTEMAESYIGLLLGQQDMQQTVVIDLVLDCMSYPDTEVADVTIRFWFRFLETMNELRPDAWKQTQCTKFSASLSRLASVCMDKLQFPPDFRRLPTDKREDFKGFRQELGDILRDCCALLGVQSVLQHCVTGLEQIVQQKQTTTAWEAIEAHLYCFRSIARHVEKSQRHDPATKATANTLVQLIFQHLAQFAQHPAIAYTSSLIISRYAEWLQQHSSFLPAQLEFLNQCIMSSTHDPLYVEWDVPRAAATALQSLAMDCWSMVGDQIVQFYSHVEAHDIMVVDDQVLILDGICHGAAQTQDLGLVRSLLERLVGPILQRLHSLFTTTGSVVNATVAMNEMLRLMSIYESVDLRFDQTDRQTHPLIWLTERIWPMFQQVLALFRHHDELVERVCRCYKRMLRTCRSHFKPFLPQLVDNLVSFYQTEPKSSYLYAGSMVLKYFYSDAETTSLLARLVTEFATTTLPLFHSMDVVQQHPDVVEEFFFLLERVVKCQPQLLLSTTDVSAALMPQTLQCAIRSLQISHNDANKGALCFLEQLLKVTTTTTSPHSAPLTQLAQMVRQYVDATAMGHDLVVQLLRGMVLGMIPSMRVETDYGSIAGVLVELAKINGAMLQQWMHEWFTLGFQDGSLQPLIAIDEAQQFQHELFATDHERAFRRAIRHFGRLCSARSTSHHDDGDEEQEPY